MKWVVVVGEGLIALERIVAVGRVEAMPMRRLLRALPPARLVSLTGGKKRETAVVLDSGHVVITAVPLAELHRRLLQAQQGDGHLVLNGGDDDERSEIFMG
ncbi:MAG: DUF370 domain-containing protein [Chloroflexi bacterium]|nr:DUF370 domain-containing protein [Chloroflexota bacterium]